MTNSNRHNHFDTGQILSWIYLIVVAFIFSQSDLYLSEPVDSDDSAELFSSVDVSPLAAIDVHESSEEEITPFSKRLISSIAGQDLQNVNRDYHRHLFLYLAVNQVELLKMQGRKRFLLFSCARLDAPPLIA